MRCCRYCFDVAIMMLAITNPLVAAITTSFHAVGPVGAEMAAFPANSTASPSGTLTLGAIPAGATILKATLYSHDWFAAPTVSALFNGNNLGATSPFSLDGGFYAYQWDVTGLITGDGTYSASASGLTNNYGLALAVAFSHPSLPSGEVFINDGAIDLSAGASVSTSFLGLSAGPGTLWLHTSADNDGGFGESGEVIRFNGAAVGGPIDANLGPYASLFDLPVSVISGTNVAGIDDPQDRFGWDVAVLTGAAVPEPASLAIWSLLVSCVIIAARARRPRTTQTG